MKQPPRGSLNQPYKQLSAELYSVLLSSLSLSAEYTVVWRRLSTHGWALSLQEGQQSRFIIQDNWALMKADADLNSFDWLKFKWPPPLPASVTTIGREAKAIFTGHWMDELENWLRQAVTYNSACHFTRKIWAICHGCTVVFQYYITSCNSSAYLHYL